MAKHPEFKKYSSLENHYRDKFILNVRQQGLTDPNIMWSVTEKFHGSNFSVIVKRDEDGKVVLVPAKRSCVIGPSDNFYSYQRALAPVEAELMRLFEYIEETEIDSNSSHFSLQFYGELVGGKYGDMVSPPQASRVQKEVQYHPDNKIVFFDIRENVNDMSVLLDVTTFENLMTSFVPSAHIAKSLFVGKFEDAFKYSKRTYGTSTTASDLFDLPKLEDNIREGNVLKPLLPAYLKCGSRVIIKHKNEVFKERHDKKSREPRTPKEEVVLGPELVNLLNTLETFITEQRLNNVISKIGEITSKDFGKILSDMTEDVLVDFKKEEEELIPLLESDFTLISKTLKGNIAQFIKPQFLNLIDGSKVD